MKCTHCGWKNPATVTFCRKCGAQLLESSSSAAFATGKLAAASRSGVLISTEQEYDDFPETRRRKRQPWIWLLLIILLLGGAGIAWWAISASQPSNGITQTLQTYCNALKGKDYHQAYQQWSSTTQMSESDFTYTQQSKPAVTGCEIDNVTTSNGSGQASLTFVYAGGSSAADQINLVQENGVWKIKSQSLS